MQNNTTSSTTYNGGIGFFGLLGIVFITLKLTGFINWSWFWVLAPIWGPISFAILILLVALIAMMLGVGAGGKWTVTKRYRRD